MIYGVFYARVYFICKGALSAPPQRQRVILALDGVLGALHGRACTQLTRSGVVSPEEALDRTVEVRKGCGAREERDTYGTAASSGERGTGPARRSQGRRAGCPHPSRMMHAPRCRIGGLVET